MLLFWMWMNEVSKTNPTPTTNGKRVPVGGLMGWLLGDVSFTGKVNAKRFPDWK